MQITMMPPDAERVQGGEEITACGRHTYHRGLLVDKNTAEEQSQNYCNCSQCSDGWLAQIFPPSSSSSSQQMGHLMSWLQESYSSEEEENFETIWEEQNTRNLV